MVHLPPLVHSKEVHTGADEYVDEDLGDYDLAELYNRFVNALNAFVGGFSGKTVHNWGAYPPQQNYTANIATNVTVQHRESFEDNRLYDYIRNGYSVINSDDANYIVQKCSTSLPPEPQPHFNLQRQSQ